MFRGSITNCGVSRINNWKYYKKFKLSIWIEIWVWTQINWGFV